MGRSCFGVSMGVRVERADDNECQGAMPDRALAGPLNNARNVFVVVSCDDAVCLASISEAGLYLVASDPECRDLVVYRKTDDVAGRFGGGAGSERRRFQQPVGSAGPTDVCGCQRYCRLPHRQVAERVPGEDGQNECDKQGAEQQR